MSSPTDVLTHAPPTFASIACGVDGSRPGFEAARQAALLTDERAALTYVTGSRGLTGAAALGSVSERVAHAAPCSVLVVRS